MRALGSQVCNVGNGVKAGHQQNNLLNGSPGLTAALCDQFAGPTT